jgi:hypothetical protein
MKNSIKKAAIAATMVSGLAIGLAQADTFVATLNLIQPIGVAQDLANVMDLGDINPASDGITCAIGASGVRTGTACFGAAAGTVGILDVTGTTGEVFDITLAPSSSNGMTFAPSVLDNGAVSSTTDLLGVTLQSSHSLTMGGTLTIDTATTAAVSGATSIDYEVTVAYQ